jgi:type I restriction enzyme R subunit
VLKENPTENEVLEKMKGSSFHVAIDDLDFTPFDGHGGRGKLYQLFGDGMGEILDELNERLAA